MNLFVDTETTGLPPHNAGWERDFQRFPHAVSIAWDYRNKTKKFIIHQEGREVPKEATAIHGITTKMANNKKLATPPKIVYNEFITDALDALWVIGHNLFFDISIIKANVLRHFGEDSEQARQVIEALDKDKRIDTMRVAQRLNGGRWPKLEVLYKLLFDEEFEGAHGAEADMLACKRCFLEMKKRKIV